MPDSYAQLVANKPVVAYSTPVLARDLRVWGPLSVSLHGSSTSIDAVWFAYIADVAPSSTSVQLRRGILRAPRSVRWMPPSRSPDGRTCPFERQELLEPGQVYEFQIEMRPMFCTFKAGHRLRLQIASEDIQYNNPLRQIDVQLLPWPVENARCTTTARIPRTCCCRSSPMPRRSGRCRRRSPTSSGRSRPAAGCRTPMDIRCARVIRLVRVLAVIVSAQSL